MTGILYTADHRMLSLPPLLSWRITHTGTVPCDSFTVRFAYRKEMAEVLSKAAGFTAEEYAKVHAPIGLPIGAETPEEIAVSVTAELIAVRAGLPGT